MKPKTDIGVTDLRNTPTTVYVPPRERRWLDRVEGVDVLWLLVLVLLLLAIAC